MKDEIIFLSSTAIYILQSNFTAFVYVYLLLCLLSNVFNGFLLQLRLKSNVVAVVVVVVADDVGLV